MQILYWTRMSTIFLKHGQGLCFRFSNLWWQFIYTQNSVPVPVFCVKKVFKPRGELVAQGGYISKENYTIKKAILVEYISKLSYLGNENHILETNDEAILFDVILEVLYEKHKDLKLRTRITS